MGLSFDGRTVIHAVACTDGESIHAACSDSQKCLLFSVGKAGNKELLSGESTCHRQKIFAVFACGFFARALPHPKSQVCLGSFNCP